MKNKLKWFMFFLLLFLILLISIVFYNKDLKNSDPIKIIYIAKNNEQEHVFWKSVSRGVSLAASEYNVNLLILSPEDENYIKQNELIYQAIKEKPDAIILSAVNQQETYPAAKSIVDNHIKLILVDSIVDENIADAVITTGNYQAGIRMGASMKKWIAEDEYIGIINHQPGSSTAIEREDGIRMGLTTDKDKIIATYYASSDIELAERYTKQLLEEYSNITVIATLSQSASIGAGRAVNALGLEDTVKIFGFDNDKEQIKYLEEGIFEALLVQKPFNMGYLGVETAIKIINNENTVTEINTGSALITRENMYTRLNQKLLFPFMDE